MIQPLRSPVLVTAAQPCCIRTAHGTAGPEIGGTGNFFARAATNRRSPDPCATLPSADAASTQSRSENKRERLRLVRPVRPQCSQAGDSCQCVSADTTFARTRQVDIRQRVRPPAVPPPKVHHPRPCRRIGFNLPVLTPNVKFFVNGRYRQEPQPTTDQLERLGTQVLDQNMGGGIRNGRGPMTRSSRSLS